MINKVWGSRLCGKVESTIYCVCLLFLFLYLAQFDQGVILHERYEDSRRTSCYIQFMARTNRGIYFGKIITLPFIAYMGCTKIPMSNIP